MGSGGKEVALELSRCTGIPVQDKDEILAKMAEVSKGWHRAHSLARHDEKRTGVIEDCLSSLMGQPDKYDFFILLDRALRQIATSEAIILGRGAHLILPQALNIRVEASFEKRIQNMRLFEGLSREEAIKRLTHSDRERAGFISALKRHLNFPPDRYEYDLVVRTDEFSINQATSIIMAAASQKFLPSRPKA
jgi:cytidylate kinase